MQVTGHAEGASSTASSVFAHHLEKLLLKLQGRRQVGTQALRDKMSSKHAGALRNWQAA